MSSWLLEVEIWFILETLQKKLSMIWDMLYSVHLSDRYNKYYLFLSVSFHFGDVWYLEYRVRIVSCLSTKLSIGRKLAVLFLFLFLFFPKPIYRVSLLTHFSPVSHFYTLWKRQKTKGSLTFSGVIEKWHWTKMGYCMVSEEELNVGIIYRPLTKFKKIALASFYKWKKKIQK